MFVCFLVQNIFTFSVYPLIMQIHVGHLEFNDVAKLGFFRTFNMIFEDTIQVDSENFSLLRIFFQSLT